MNSPFPLPGAPSADEALLRAADAAARFAFDNAGLLDVDGSFPTREISELHRLGLLAATLPRFAGGGELSTGVLARVLRAIGGGSLIVGRLYEGHVNALGLIRRYGTAAQLARATRQVDAGRLFGVWNTDDAQGLRLVRETAGWRLLGRKILCSGAGRLDCPLVTATDETGRRLMVVARLDGAARADLSSWTAAGMRASATGAFDFSGLAVAREDIIGEDGDYERQPAFSAGAWRFCAVQQGGMETLLDLLRAHLVRTQRGGDPHQSARLGQAAILVETAKLWVERAAETADDETVGTDLAVNYVNLARLAVERCGLELMELAHRSIGLQSFMRPAPVERIARDLATYLRQPAPDRALTHGAGFVLASERNARNLWEVNVSAKEKQV